MLPDIGVDSGLEFHFSETWRCVIWSSDEDTVRCSKLWDVIIYHATSYKKTFFSYIAAKTSMLTMW